MRENERNINRMNRSLLGVVALTLLLFSLSHVKVPKAVDLMLDKINRQIESYIKVVTFKEDEKEKDVGEVEINTNYASVECGAKAITGNNKAVVCTSISKRMFINK